MKLILLILAVFQCSAELLPKGIHDFPNVMIDGALIANEFQLIHPENINLDALNSVTTDSAATYQITSVSPVSISNNGVVTVSFYSSSPSSKDWIGACKISLSSYYLFFLNYIYFIDAPLDVSTLTSTVPIKYGYCDDSSDYLKSGSGTLLFNLTNVRTSVGFVYYTNGLTKPTYLTSSSSSQTVNFINVNEPLKPRIVPTGDYNVFNLLWSSATSTKPTLKWGLVSGDYTNKIVAVTTTIEKSEMCGGTASSTGWFDLGLIHTASLIGMEGISGQSIYYIFGDDDTSDYSTEYVFRVPPYPGTQPSDRSTTVVLCADLGRGSTDGTYTWDEYGRPAMYTAMSVGAQVAEGTIDAVFHNGDLSYATGAGFSYYSILSA